MDHWPLQAQRWALVGPPLRPSADDVAIAADAIATWTRAHARAPRGLLLGATPELAALPCATLTAIDREASMLTGVFPRGPGRDAAIGDWRALPCRDRAFDVVLGDGCLSNLAFPGDYRRVAGELARVLADDGVAVLRLFAAPELRESLREVADALAAGSIGSFHALKWRVAMAVQPDERNVRVSDIWRGLAEIAPDRDVLAAATGWPRPVIDHVDVYRASTLVYSFPTVAEAGEALAGLAVVGSRIPTYELGERCPTLRLRRL